MMKKQKYKSHFFKFDKEVYEKLIDFGFRNSDINVLAQSPSTFFAYFQKYSKNVADELKHDAYMYAFRVIINKVEKGKKEETWEIYSKF